MSKIQLAGRYYSHPDGFYHEVSEHRILLLNRAKKAGKPENFLLLKPCCGNSTLPDGKKDRYISGLYYTSPTTARIDFNGIRYTVTFTADGFVIEPPYGFWVTGTPSNPDVL